MTFRIEYNNDVYANYPDSIYTETLKFTIPGQAKPFFLKVGENDKQLQKGWAQLLESIQLKEIRDKLVDGAANYKAFKEKEGCCGMFCDCCIRCVCFCHSDKIARYPAPDFKVTSKDIVLTREISLVIFAFIQEQSKKREPEYALEAGMLLQQSLKNRYLRKKNRRKK